MKIKQYLGTDMRDALRQIRQDLGPDAVILATRPLGQGVEVSAAIDAAALQNQSATAYIDIHPARDAAVTPAFTLPIPPSVVVEQTAMRDELRTLRQLLERQLGALAWNDFTRREPLRSQVLTELTELGLSRDIAMSVLAELPAQLNAEQAQRLHFALLARRIGECDPLLDTAGAVALVGAAGSGKTTMLAKLALRWLLEHGGEGLSIVMIDDEHIGAADQARSLGRLLGVPSFRFADGAEFAAEAVRFADQKMVLIDTPALSDNAAATELLAAGLSGIRSTVQRMLLLPASAQSGVLDEMVRRAKPLAVTSCAITRFDEAASLGGVLSTLARSHLPVAYVSDGPRIPDDLRPARAHQLVARAVELARLADLQMDAELLAQRYGGQINAAT